MNRIKETNRLLAENLVRSIMKDYEACGIAAAIIDKNGVTQYEKFWGVRDLESQKELDGETIFGLASVTKSFTALAIMQMEERGILKLDDPVSRYVPEFTNKNQKTVTIRHLLTHSGGFFPLPRILVDQVAAEMGLDEKEVGDLAYNDALADEGVRRVAERLDAQTEESGLNGEPGEYLSYCNDGFGLLSDIVRRHSGYGSFAEYLDKKILKPIGMDRSNISFIRNSQDENAAILYSLENGTWRADRDYQNDAFVLHGGGGMKSTLGDMLKYAVMYLNEGVAGNGNRIVERYAVQEMEKPRQFMKPGIYYGYGLETKQVGDRAVYEHGGSLPGVSSNFSFCPQEEVGIVVLCNTMDVSVAAIADAALNAYCGLEVEEERQIHAERSWSAEELEELAGSYVSGEGDAFTLTVENGTLSMKVNGNPTALQAVYPWQGMVRKTYSDIYLTAIRDEEGHVFAARYGSRIFPKEA